MITRAKFFAPSCKQTTERAFMLNISYQSLAVELFDNKNCYKAYDKPKRLFCQQQG